MEKLNFVRDGSVKLPPGFRFQPTEEEIVFQYLTRKVFSLPLPASVVPEITLFNYDPWDLPGDGEPDKYFFTKKEPKYPNGTRTKRRTSSGYWKASGSDKRITCPTRKDIVGMRKTLVFHGGNPPNGSRTDWVMHEYRLVNSGISSLNFQNQNLTHDQNASAQMGNWVMCRIFMKIRSTVERETGGVAVAQPRVGDFLIRDFNDLGQSSTSSSSSSTSSSGSSVITDVTSSGFDH